MHIIDNFLPLDVLEGLVKVMEINEPTRNNNGSFNSLLPEKPATEEEFQKLMADISSDNDRYVNVMGALKNQERMLLWDLYQDTEFHNLVKQVCIEQFFKLYTWKKFYETQPWEITVRQLISGGYFAWHDDGWALYSLTVYLDKEWNQEWGGFLTVGDPNEPYQKSVIPKFNRAVCFPTPLKHYVTPTVDFAPTRKSLQLFVMKAL